MVVNGFSYIIIVIFKNKFIFGSVGSSLLHVGFLYLLPLEAHDGAGAVVHAFIRHVGIDGLVPGDTLFDMVLQVETFSGLQSLGGVSHDAAVLELRMHLGGA